MLRRMLCVSHRTSSQLVRWSSQTATAGKPKEKWDIMAGVLVERLPVISRDLTPFEQEYSKMLADIEFENSMKSDHEIRHERDLRMAEKLKKGDMELDLDETVKQTAQDMEDAYTEELKRFEFASRTTEADRKNDTKSLDRKLDQTLILLVEQQIGNKKHYILPQCGHQEGETLRETAERVVRERCGGEVPVQIYGNAPVGFYKYKYPADQRKQSVGAKVFFYRGVLGDQASAAKIPSGFEWLTTDELKAKPLPAEYLKSVQSFVL